MAQKPLSLAEQFALIGVDKEDEMHFTVCTKCSVQFLTKYTGKDPMCPKCWDSVRPKKEMKVHGMPHHTIVPKYTAPIQYTKVVPTSPVKSSRCVPRDGYTPDGKFIKTGYFFDVDETPQTGRQVFQVSCTQCHRSFSTTYSGDNPMCIECRNANGIPLPSSPPKTFHAPGSSSSPPPLHGMECLGCGKKFITTYQGKTSYCSDCFNAVKLT